MAASSLVHEAELLYEQGNHGEAIARLTSALKSGPSDQETQRIEELINKLGVHVFENGAESGSRDIGGGGSRGIGTQLASSFFSPSGSSNAQLGKLALLGTVLAGNQKSSGSGLQTALSLFTGYHQNSGSGSSSGGWATLASKFFSHGQGQAPASGGYGGQAHQDTSTFSKLSSLANSYVSNQGGQYGSQEGRYGGDYAQAGHSGPSASGGSQSKLSAVASMASNYLSGHGSNSGRTGESNHSTSEGGHNDGLSSLASVASNIMGHGNGRHEPPSAYGNPNIGDNGFNFTGGSHLAPL
ncbi:hypothetical protein ZYGR_0K00590 [Zygosaccharomyces rouxii]|uniref:Uncharacterized protein n=1 Tax=Zygosaccharomyces rouxii TaxID=4956 RepID=A0A1Q2ZYM6_ZYGRO|nr:hypothetical protein ZYGR_0K00590 [Zygosaccharomyces rouxii]